MVKTLGYSNIVSLLLTVPPYVLAVITSFLNAWHADRTGERYFHITLPLYIAMFAFILAVATTAKAPRYVAMMLMVPGIYTGYVVALAWISNTLPRPPAKVSGLFYQDLGSASWYASSHVTTQRAAALAAINAFSNSAPIYASYMYPESAGPRFGKFPSSSVLPHIILVISSRNRKLANQ